MGKLQSVLEFEMLLKTPMFSRSLIPYKAGIFCLCNFLAVLSPNTILPWAPAHWPWVPDRFTLPWVLALLELSKRSQPSSWEKIMQQWAGKGWLLHAFLPSRVRVQKFERAGMPTCKDAHKQLERVFVGVTEAGAYLQLVYGVGPQLEGLQAWGIPPDIPTPSSSRENAGVTANTLSSSQRQAALGSVLGGQWTPPSLQDMPPAAGRH